MASSDWKEVDPQTLPGEIAEAFAAMKKAYKVYQAGKVLFEDKMQEAFAGELREGQELKFGYNFGKLSIAVGPVREKKAKMPKQVQSLGDWLRDQAAGGQRT